MKFSFAFFAAPVALLATPLQGEGAPPQAPASAPAMERVLDLSIDEALRRTVATNPALAAASLSVESAATGIDVALGAFEPVAFANPRISDSRTPTASQLAGAQNFERNTIHFDTGVRQTLPTGGSYTLTFQTDNDRTNNQFSTLNPQTVSTFSVSFTQPLLRGAWTGYGRIPEASAALARDQAAASRDQQEIDLLQTVSNLYWDLVFAIADRDVKLRSLSLAERLLEINRRKVEEGLLAEVQIYQAQADVATRREALLTAENVIRAAEDSLKQQLFPFENRSEWNFRIRPTSAPPRIGSIPVPAWPDAVISAFAHRPDIERLRLLARGRELDVEARSNETLPLLNFVGSAGDTGLAARADQTISDLVDVRFPNYSVALAIEVPLGNRAALARKRQAEAEASVARQNLRVAELAAVREVRDAVRQLTYGQEKVAAAAKSREFAEKQLRAEELRYEQGLSTNFEVLSLQRDLAQALTNEQQAILDYAKAAVALDRSTGTLAPPK